MPNVGSLQTELARSLLLAFSVSRNSSEFCRFLAVVSLRDLKARTALLVRRDLDGSLRLNGQHGLLSKRIDGSEFQIVEEELLQQAISGGCVIKTAAESTGRGFLAIPFNTTSPVQGAIGVGFAIDSDSIVVSDVELELIQLLSELMAVNSLPRMRATGMLSKIYFDSDALDDQNEFTARQLRILDELAIGKTNVQIARSLSVSESTIKQETVKIFRRLGVSNRQRAVSVSKEMGII